MEKFLKELFVNQSYDENNFFLIAGPCVVESEELIHEISEKVSGICKNLGIPYISKLHTVCQPHKRLFLFGLGDELPSLYCKSKKEFASCSHEPQGQPRWRSMLMYCKSGILCRQTDLLETAAKTGRIINVKKGQFVSGEAMKFAVEKIRNAGNEKIMLTERGNTFGYHDLVVDYRNIPIMKSHGVPVIMDCTHSLQQPNQTTGITGGNPQMIGTIARAAIATGADGLFIETHPNPSSAKRLTANCCNG